MLLYRALRYPNVEFHITYLKVIFCSAFITIDHHNFTFGTAIAAPVEKVQTLELALHIFSSIVSLTSLFNAVHFRI